MVIGLGRGVEEKRGRKRQRGLWGWGCCFSTRRLVFGRKRTGRSWTMSKDDIDVPEAYSWFNMLWDGLNWDGRTGIFQG